MSIANMVTSTSAPLPTKDRVIISCLLSFVVIAWTLEVYWWWYADRLTELVHTDWLIWLWSLYGEADRSFFDPVSPYALAMESFNIFVTQLFNLWLIWAIVKNRPYRHVLQLGIGAFVSYSVLLYYWTVHLSDYADMTARTMYHFLMFYLPNAPWLIVSLYMVYDSTQAITRRFEEG
ncbi:MAG: EXPERA domain-containing protein [Gemmataceae bacterium]